MTDQTQSAVEVMARAFVRAKGNDPDAFAAGAGAMRDLVNAVLNTRVSAEQTMRDERLHAGDQELYRVDGEKQ